MVPFSFKRIFPFPLALSYHTYFSTEGNVIDNLVGKWVIILNIYVENLFDRNHLQRYSREKNIYCFRKVDPSLKIHRIVYVLGCHVFVTYETVVRGTFSPSYQTEMICNFADLR